MNKEEKLKLRELHLSANADQRHILEEFYPELKESEDERIRKETMTKKEWIEVLDFVYEKADYYRAESKTPEEYTA